MASELILVLAVICLFAAVIIVIVSSRKTKSTFDTIEQMVKDAMEGRWVAETFDESRLSALETRFAQFLAASDTSAQNLAAERDKIRSLISDISHQTKTPIANLLLYSELLSEQDLPEDAQADAAAIRQQAESLRFLIDALVKLSRLENGILTLSPKPEPLQPMLQSICEQFGARAAEKGLMLTLQDTALSAVFDPKWTAEALGNMVDNAIKYTNQGQISISAKEYELFVRMDIADTGMGIAEAEAPKIFSRFYRAEKVREQEGVGIGLYLSREIISNEGGYIKVISSPGRGSTFSIFLPKQEQFLQNC